MAYEQFFQSIAHNQPKEESADQNFDFSPPEFPLDALPPGLAKTIKHVSLYNRVPASANATVALNVLGACAGKQLRIQTHPGRHTRANTFALIAKPSGWGGSECLRQWLPPLHKFETQRHEAYEHDVITWQTRIQALDSQLKNLKTQVGKADDPDERRELERQMEELNASIKKYEDKMHEPQMLANDVTSEALALIMSQNNQHAFSVASEGKVVLANLLGKYSDSGETEESIYLQGFSGDFYRTNRISRKIVMLEDPCLSCMWVVQNRVLKEIIRNKELIEDGLLPRFLFYVASEPIPPIDPDLAPPDQGIINYWGELCDSVLRNYYLNNEEYTVTVPKDVYLNFVEFINCAIMHMNNGMEDVGSFLARWGEIAFRLALQLHLARHGAHAHTISLAMKTAQDALRLVQYYATVQMFVLRPRTEDQQFQAVRRLCKLIQERFDGATTVRTLTRNHSYKGSEIETLVQKFPHLLKLENLPTGVGGSEKRMISIVHSS